MTNHSSTLISPSLEPIVTGKPAPKVTMIRIEVGDHNVTFHCKPRETPESKMMLFVADKDCELYFTNGNVFDKPSHSLQANVPWITMMSAKAQTNEETECYVKMEAGKPNDRPGGDPIIVVP